MALTPPEIQRINGLFAQIDSLTARVKERDKSLDETSLEVRNLSVQKVKLTTALNERQSEIVKLQQELSELRQTSTLANKLIEELRTDVKEIFNSVVKKRTKSTRKTSST